MPVLSSPYFSAVSFPPATSGAVAERMMPLVAELQAAAAAGELTADAWREGWDRAIATLKEIDDSDERGDWLEPIFRLGEPFGFMRE